MELEAQETQHAEVRARCARARDGEKRLAAGMLRPGSW